MFTLCAFKKVRKSGNYGSDPVHIGLGSFSQRCCFDQHLKNFFLSVEHSAKDEVLEIQRFFAFIRPNSQQWSRLQKFRLSLDKFFPLLKLCPKFRTKDKFFIGVFFPPLSKIQAGIAGDPLRAGKRPAFALRLK